MTTCITCKTLFGPLAPKICMYFPFANPQFQSWVQSLWWLLMEKWPQEPWSWWAARLMPARAQPWWTQRPSTNHMNGLKIMWYSPFLLHTLAQDAVCTQAFFSTLALLPWTLIITLSPIGIISKTWSKAIKKMHKLTLSSTTNTTLCWTWMQPII